MNGIMTPPSTPGNQASGSSSATRRPQTLKKRRPSEVDASPAAASKQASSGPSSLRKEVRVIRRTERRESRRRHFMKRILKYEPARKLLHTSIGAMALWMYVNHTDVYVLVVYLTRALVVITSVDMLRFASRRFERVYEKALGFLMRESEKTSWNGTIWYLLGVIFVLSVLPRDIAMLSVLLLSWCDTSASVFGRKFGKYTPKLPSPPFATGKSFAGTFSAFLFGGLSAYIFYTYAAPLGHENDLSWLGHTSAVVPAWLKRHNPLTTYAGPSTGFPDYIKVGKQAMISTKLPRPSSTMTLWQVELVCAVAAAIAEGLDVYGLDDNITLPVISGLIIWAAFWATSV